MTTNSGRPHLPLKVGESYPYSVNRGRPRLPIGVGHAYPGGVSEEKQKMRNNQDPTQPGTPGHVRARTRQHQNMIYDDHMTNRTTPRPGTPRAHMALRRNWAPIVNTGTLTCRRCHTPIQPGQPWDLGHPADRPYATGNHNQDLQPEHRKCNRSGIVTNKTPTFNW